MMCHRIGRSPISTMGLGLEAVSSDRRVPRPPARMTTFTTCSLPEMTDPWMMTAVYPPSAPGLRPRLWRFRRGDGCRRRRTTVPQRAVQVERLGGAEEQVLQV